MSFWTAIVIIVAITVIGSVFRSHHNARVGYATDEEGKPIGPSPREKELESEIKQLRERVQVLERIATDGNDTKRLSAEIDKLRDE